LKSILIGGREIRSYKTWVSKQDVTSESMPPPYRASNIATTMSGSEVALDLELAKMKVSLVAIEIKKKDKGHWEYTRRQ
jgi:hypothetical protein